MLGSYPTLAHLNGRRSTMRPHGIQHCLDQTLEKLHTVRSEKAQVAPSHHHPSH